MKLLQIVLNSSNQSGSQQLLSFTVYDKIKGP